MSSPWADKGSADHPISEKSIIPWSASVWLSRIVTIVLLQGDLTRPISVHSTVSDW